MLSVVVDQEADAAFIDLKPDVVIVRSVPIGRGLVAHYDDQNDLATIDVLSSYALAQPEVIDQLHDLLGEQVRLLPASSDASSSVTRNFARTILAALTNRPDHMAVTSGRDAHLVGV